MREPKKDGVKFKTKNLLNLISFNICKFPHAVYFYLFCLGTVVGIDEDHDIVVSYSSGNR